MYMVVSNACRGPPAPHLPCLAHLLRGMTGELKQGTGSTYGANSTDLKLDGHETNQVDNREIHDLVIPGLYEDSTDSIHATEQIDLIDREISGSARAHAVPNRFQVPTCVHVCTKVQHYVLQYPLRKLHGVNYPRSFVLSFAIREAFFTTVPLQLADTDAGLRNTPGQATSASASSF
ncbi:hypothetical protein QX201_008705 [Fusarium graminearum]